MNFTNKNRGRTVLKTFAYETESPGMKFRQNIETFDLCTVDPFNSETHQFYPSHSFESNKYCVGSPKATSHLGRFHRYLRT